MKSGEQGRLAFALGMAFGGEQLLHQTVQELVEAHRSAR